MSLDSPVIFLKIYMDMNPVGRRPDISSSFCRIPIYSSGKAARALRLPKWVNTRTAQPSAKPSQWPGPGRLLGLGQSDRRLFGLFGSTKSCLKMKLPLGETIVGGTFRISLIGVDFVSALCAKAIVGPAKAQATINIIALFIVTILVQPSKHLVPARASTCEQKLPRR